MLAPLETAVVARAIPKRPYISFKAFFLLWAEFQGWKVPAFHETICDWLENRGPEGVLQVFRGGSKSTILGVYQSWRFREDYRHRIIDRSADDSTASKLTADTEHILRMHPLCRGLLPNQTGAKRFSVIGNPDKRNASLTAYGILSNATSSRADEIINDDVEVPGNITPDKRITLLQRLQEEIHIIVPGGKILYVGTPHTHDSIYDDKIKNGYDSLTIPLFSRYIRHEAIGGRAEFHFDFDESDLYVMIGIGRGARVLDPHEYELQLTPGSKGGYVRLYERPTEGTVIDIAAGNVWAERFTREEIGRKRKECRTLNAWDSQYRLIAKPVHEVRLDPDRLLVYASKPEIRCANNAIAMMLEEHIQLTGARACWDCSLGKADSDDSAFAVMFQTETGHMYWQVLDVLMGEVFEQCAAIVDRVIEYQLPSVTIKTKGVGGFLPAVLRRVLKERGVQCGVAEMDEKENKANRILKAFEPALSGQFLHVHESVFENLAPQMREWIPSKMNQPDDLLDAGEGCISMLPVKIGKVVKDIGAGNIPQAQPRQEWRQFGGTYEVKVDYNGR